MTAVWRSFWFNRRNFAAGMSGGVAYVWDKSGDFNSKLNPELVDLDPIEQEDKDLLMEMLTKHVQFTGSEVAQSFLDNFESSLKSLVKVMPRDYKAVLKNARQRQNNKKRRPCKWVSLLDF